MHAVRDAVVRSRDVMTMKIGLHGYVYSNFYEYGAPLCGLRSQRGSAKNYSYIDYNSLMAYNSISTIVMHLCRVRNINLLGGNVATDLRLKS